MNRFWHQALNQTTRGLDDFAISRLKIEDPRWKRTSGITFTQRLHSHAGFVDGILDIIIGVGFVGCNPSLLRQVKIVPAIGTGVTDTSGCQKELNRLAPFGHHNMDLDPIKIAFFAGLVTTPNLPRLVSAASGRWDNYHRKQSDSCPAHRPLGCSGLSRFRPTSETSS